MAKKNHSADPEKYLKDTARAFAEALRKHGNRIRGPYTPKEYNEALANLKKAAIVFGRLPDDTDRLRGIQKLKRDAGVIQLTLEEMLE